MERESSEALLAAARIAALTHDDTIVARLDRAIATTDDPGELGRLNVALALALQGRGEPTASAAAAERAAPLLLRAGHVADAAHAMSMAAVFADQTGDVAGAVDLAVGAMVLLADVELGDLQAVRAAIGLAGFFSRLSAFDLAIDLGERAFEGAQRLTGVAIDAVAYSFGYIAAEGGHVTADDALRTDWLGRAEGAARWLQTRGSTPGSRLVLGGGLAADIAHARGERADVAGLEAGGAHYGDVAQDFVAWHRLVRATAEQRRGDDAAAIALLELAVPDLLASADNHCVVRALTVRSQARAAQGDLAGALADATELARLTRGWQVTQVGRLASQVARRVDLERASTSLRGDVARLVHAIDLDPTTGVRSRHWWDRHVTELETQGGDGAITMVDIDHFKQVNDVHGHVVGDVVLAEFGALVQVAAGRDAAVARFGGEEFVVISRPADAEQATAMAERIRVATASHGWDAVAPGVHITTSVGVAFGDLGSSRTLLVRADRALLDAKRLGRDRVVAARPPR